MASSVVARLESMLAPMTSPGSPGSTRERSSFETRPEHRPGDLSWEALRLVAQTDASRALSKDLRKRGFAFVGPTTCYAFMQAMGLVNDHMTGCFCRDEVEAERHALVRPT